MNIYYASSEVVPFAKTGGLADVAGALPIALAERGHQVTVITPRYGIIDREKHHLTPLSGELTISMGGTEHGVTLMEGSLAGQVRVLLVDCPPLFDREGLYGTPEGDYPDNGIRFGLFCRTIARLVANSPEPVDILHLNDWQTAMTPLFLDEAIAQQAEGGQQTSRPPVVFTIHNLGYQGLTPPDILPALGLGWEHYTMDRLEFYGRVSFLKGGLIYSDLITTVSQTYAQEIQTPDFGFGLDGVLRAKAERLVGVVNGVDYTIWNPGLDNHLAAQYDHLDMSGKALCKRDLQQSLGLPNRPRTPLIGMISRLASQKGFDILKETLERLMSLNLQLVILGTGDVAYEKFFREQSADPRFQDKLSVNIAFNNNMAHKIEAGCDMFLMPSRYEPCGLNQLYSLRYGTVPVVRSTGGLADTVEEFDPTTGTGTGFTFSDYQADDLLMAVARALKVYRSRNREIWYQLMRNGMESDYSWSSSAAAYEDHYKSLRQRPASKGN